MKHLQMARHLSSLGERTYRKRVGSVASGVGCGSVRLLVQTPFKPALRLNWASLLKYCK